MVDAPAATDAYNGPMDLPISYADRADVWERGGSAARALECADQPSNGGGADYDSGLASTQRSPEAAVDNWMDEEGSWYAGCRGGAIARSGSRRGRVLYSHDVDGLTKAAVIVSDSIHDYEDETGWGVAAWAVCDPAELEAATTNEMGIEVWTDAAGRRVSTAKVSSAAGPEHCDWQDITFLTLGEGGHRRLFVRDTLGEFAELTTTTYADDVTLPADAEPTGWSHDGRELWLGADGGAAYLVSAADGTDVERWPAGRETIGCD